MVTWDDGLYTMAEWPDGSPLLDADKLALWEAVRDTAKRWANGRMIGDLGDGTVGFIGKVPVSWWDGYPDVSAVYMVDDAPVMFEGYHLSEERPGAHRAKGCDSQQDPAGLCRVTWRCPPELPRAWWRPGAMTDSAW